VPRLLVGTKTDLPRAISFCEASAAACRHGMPYVECSALSRHLREDGHGVHMEDGLLAPLPHEKEVESLVCVTSQRSLLDSIGSSDLQTYPSDVETEVRRVYRDFLESNAWEACQSAPFTLPNGNEYIVTTGNPTTLGPGSHNEPDFFCDPSGRMFTRIGRQLNTRMLTNRAVYAVVNPTPGSGNVSHGEWNLSLSKSNRVARGQNKRLDYDSLECGDCVDIDEHDKRAGVGDVFHLVVAMATGLEPLYAVPNTAAERCHRQHVAKDKPKMISNNFLAELKAKAEVYAI